MSDIVNPALFWALPIVATIAVFILGMQSSLPRSAMSRLANLASHLPQFLGRKETLKVVVVLAMLVLAFSAGMREWDLNGKKASFYQATYRPAVAITCGYGFHNIRETRNPGIIQKFLAGQVSGMECEDAFDPEKTPTLLPVASFNQQTIASQYLFAFLWKFGGINWDAAKYVTGMLVAGLLLAVFAFSRLLLGFYPAIALAGATSLFSPAVSEWIVHLRDFSKAPFMIGLAAFFAWIVVAAPRHLPILGLGAAVTAAIGIGFRPDASLFLVLIPLAFAVRMLERASRWKAAVGAVCFIAAAWTMNAFVLNYTAALGRFSPHYVILGQNIGYINNIGFGPAHQGAFLQYFDRYAFGLVSFYSQFAGIEKPIWDSESYDHAARVYLLDTLTVFPANYLIQAGTAAFKSLFPIGIQLEVFGLVLLLVTVFLIAAGFRKRGLAVLTICLLLGGLSGVQFHARHHFYLGILGWVLISAAIVSNTLGLSAGRPHAAGVRRFLAPAIESFRLRYGLASWAVLALLCIFPLFLLRPYQNNQVAAEIEKIRSFPARPLPVLDRSNAGMIVFDASGIKGSAYFSARELAGSCAQFPSIALQYRQANPNYDRPVTIPIPKADIKESFFPSVLQLEESEIATITLSEIEPGCDYGVYVIEPDTKFLPLVFYGPPSAMRSYYYSRTFETRDQ